MKLLCLGATSGGISHFCAQSSYGFVCAALVECALDQRFQLRIVSCCLHAIRLVGMIRGELHPISVAPMMDRTDRHFRYLVRLISRHTLLYTEMVTTPAIVHGPWRRLLAYNPQEHPIALQLGGDDAAQLVHCARLAEDLGFDEINLNVGCPSDRVQKARIGACLMEHPNVVADAVAAMRAATKLPVTVKHRVGIDDHDSYEFMHDFVQRVAEAGCDKFTVHARIAILGGLSPKDNRRVPPLRYHDVYRLKKDMPYIRIELNGGVTSLDCVDRHLLEVDAVMIGRAAYDNPLLFAQADRKYFGAHHATLPELETSLEYKRREVAEAMAAYVDCEVAQGVPTHSVTRHMFGLFTGVPGARNWRRALSTLRVEGGERVLQALRAAS